jgi:hypothetical protein
LQDSISVTYRNGVDSYDLKLEGKFIPDGFTPERQHEGDMINSAIVQIAKAVEEKFFPQQLRENLWGAAYAGMIRSD